MSCIQNIQTQIGENFIEALKTELEKNAAKSNYNNLISWANFFDAIRSLESLVNSVVLKKTQNTSR